MKDVYNSFILISRKVKNDSECGGGDSVFLNKPDIGQWRNFDIQCITIFLTMYVFAVVLQT